VSETATLAGGCFWGVEELFRNLPGVIDTNVGYTGGSTANPKYEDVKTGRTGHAESLQIEFDPSKISYDEILDHFFRLHDPTQLNRQGPDIGENYRSVIFYQDENQKSAAKAMINELNRSATYHKPIVTTLEKSGRFWPAEDYHQKFTAKTGRGACHVDYSSVD